MMNLRTFFFTIILVPKPKNLHNWWLTKYFFCPTVCLTGSVYCEEVSPEMTAVPSLPKETAYLRTLQQNDQNHHQRLSTLRRIDLTGNLISEIEDGAFSKLPLLEELNISELAKIPMLPAKLVSFNDNYNQLTTKACKHTTNIFSLKLTKMAYLYLGNNELETTPLPESLHIVHYMPTSVFQGNNTQYIRANMEEVRLDSNPLMLAKHPNSFVCLRALPIGPYH
uniref:Osteoglycin n=1 Tax=Oncorhynchus mykiss TaxID=8022 RepID=A0A8C7SGP4_ONCMY